MNDKIDAYHALRPGQFDRLVRLEIVPSDEGSGDSVDLNLEVAREDGARLIIRFVGATGLRIDDFRASGHDFFEIWDMRAERGWEAWARYSVREYDGPMRFYCADFSAEVVQ